MIFKGQAKDCLNLDDGQEISSNCTAYDLLKISLNDAHAHTRTHRYKSNLADRQGIQPLIIINGDSSYQSSNTEKFKVQQPSYLSLINYCELSAVIVLLI